MADISRGPRLFLTVSIVNVFGLILYFLMPYSRDELMPNIGDLLMSFLGDLLMV